MDYISKRKKLTNEPYYLSYSELREMMAQNERDRLECFHVTESTYRGESYYKGDGRPGNEKVGNSMGLSFGRLHAEMHMGFIWKLPIRCRKIALLRSYISDMMKRSREKYGRRWDRGEASTRRKV